MKEEAFEERLEILEHYCKERRDVGQYVSVDPALILYLLRLRAGLEKLCKERP